jgi:hypothetical protein
MFHSLTHEQAKRDYPKEYQALLTQYKGKKSFKDLKIGYDLVEMIQGCSFADMLAGKGKEPSTIKDKMKEFEKNARVSLQAGRLYEPLQKIPQVFIDQRRAGLEKDETERKRYASLTPEQQDQETLGLLKQLAGPGFVCLNPDDRHRKLCARAGVKTIQRHV